MLFLLLVALLSKPLPPEHFTASRVNGFTFLEWVQNSDANVVCVDQVSNGASLPLGCSASIPGVHQLSYPAAPDGTGYYITEWYRTPSDTWINYGTSGPAILPYRVFLSLINTSSPRR